MSNETSGRNDGFFAQMRKLGVIRQDSRWLGGVAAGCAQRFGIDVVLVRGIAVALSILGGLGLVIYGVAWALLPDEQGRIHLQEALRKNWTGGMTGALVMVVLGIFPAPWFLNSLGPILWPVAIVAAVLLLIFKRSNTKYDDSRPSHHGGRQERHSHQPHGHGERATQSAGNAATVRPMGSSLEKPWRGETRTMSARAAMPPADPAAPSQEHTMSSQQPDPTGPADHGRDAHDATAPGFTRPFASGPAQGAVASKAAKEAAKQRKARLAPPVPGWVATTVVGLTVLVVALVLSLDYLNIVALPGNGWAVALACGLLVIGLALVFAAAAKRTSGGLLGLAIPLLVLTIIFGGNTVLTGQRTVLNVDDSGRSYSAVFSNSTLDLTQQGSISRDTTVEISSVFSQLQLQLPDNVPVKIETDGVFISDRDRQLPQQQRQFPQGTPTLTIDVDGVFSSVSTVVGTGSTSNPSF